MYKCPNPECKSTTRFSEKWVNPDSEGKTDSKCLRCDTNLAKETIDISPKSARINTRGCSGGSTPWTH